MSREKPTGLKRIILAGGHTLRGLGYVWKSEAAFRQEVILALILIPLTFWFDVSKVEQALMIFAVVLVIIVEILNSAIEAVVDRVGLEHHHLSGSAKDMGSAAVGVSLALLLAVWLMILI